MKRFALGLLFALWSSLALAQGCGPQNPNCIVPTPPLGTNNNQAASTAFVQNAFANNAIVSVTNASFAGGAIGDCIHDDGPAFNAAGLTSNTTVMVPAPPGGCYFFATAVVTGNGVWSGITATSVSTIQNVEFVGIAGHGGAQNLSFGSFDPGSKAIQVKWGGTAGGTPWTFSGPGSFALRNISIDGNAANAGTTLFLRGLYRSRIENVSVWNWGSIGIKHQSTPTLPTGLSYGTCVNQFFNVTGISTGYTAVAGIDMGATDSTTGPFDVCRDQHISTEFTVDNAAHTACALIIRGIDISTFMGGVFSGSTSSKSLCVIPPTLQTTLPGDVLFVNTGFTHPMSFPDDGTWNCSGNGNQGITFENLSIPLLNSGGGVLPVSTHGCIHGYTSGGLLLGPLNLTAAWTAFTATPTCGTAAITTTSARASTIGKTTTVEIDFLITAIGTCTNTLSFTLPIASQSSASLVGQETVNSNNIVACIAFAMSATMRCVMQGVAAFAVNARIVASGVYENQ
jgi:hypothetical protein